MKKKIEKIIKDENYISLIFFLLKNLYKKVKYIIKYKYKNEVDNGMILFNASNGFNGKIKELYEKMVCDKKYDGCQFVVALNSSEKEKFLVKNTSTLVVSGGATRILSKVKYYFTDKIDLHFTPKKEQVIILTAYNPKSNNNLYSSFIKKMEIKYIKKYVDYNCEKVIPEVRKDGISRLKNQFIKKYNIDLSKKIVQLKIYKKNDIITFFKENNLKKLYKKYNDNYQFLLNTNIDIDWDLLSAYNNFFVNLSNEEEILVDYFSDLLITNDKLFDFNNQFLNSQKLIVDNFNSDVRSITGFLDLNINTEKRLSDGSTLKCYLENNFYINEILPLKIDSSKTFTTDVYKNKFLIFKSNLKTILGGFFRTHFFPLSNNYKKLLKLKNKYKGKRCFLVGNGPSLTTEDLDLIKDEYSFGCNLIYRLYDKTKWRPTFHFLLDGIFAKNHPEELVNEICSDIFASQDVYYYLNKYDLKQELVYVKMLALTPHTSKSFKFTSPMKYGYPGGTVMTMMFSLAVYMGFDEIYLLGVDCTSSVSKNGHCIKGYMSDSVRRQDMKRVAKRLNKSFVTEEEVAKYYYDRVINSYSVIQKYAQKHGIKIFNCTRGGALEVYKRKKLEDVIKTRRK